jgi:hypothetical protein
MWSIVHFPNHITQNVIWSIRRSSNNNLNARVSQYTVYVFSVCRIEDVVREEGTVGLTELVKPSTINKSQVRCTAWPGDNHWPLETQGLVS